MVESSPRLRVAMLGSEEFDVRPGGLNRYFSDLRGAMDAAGHDVRSVTLRSRTTPVPLAWRLVRSAVRTASYARRALRVSSGTDVIDGHFALYAALPFLVRGERTPRIVHFHGPWAAESVVSGTANGLVQQAKRTIEKVVYQRADHVITLSRSFATAVLEYGVDPSAVSVIPPGVDLDRFVDRDRRSARRALELADGHFVVVCARRLEKRMGVDVLLRAFSRVAQGHPNCRLLIAGTGSQSAELEQLAASLPGSSSVRMLGRVPDDELAALYRAADCSVVPTLSLEGFGLVVLESLASGTPVLASDIGGLPEALDGLPQDLLVPPGDEAALAARLSAAVAGALPTRAACRAHAESFSWSQAAQRHTALYRSLLDARSRG